MRFEEVAIHLNSDLLERNHSNSFFTILKEATSIKKRKLNSDRRFQFEETIKAATEHLEQMEMLLEGDSKSQDLEKRHVENKPLLDHVLKSGHVLLDELQNGNVDQS